MVRKAYAYQFVGAVAAVVLGVAIWFLVHPQQEPGLLWGGTVYTTEEQFKGYLKSKGLSYKNWLAKYPGAAPWEPDLPATAAPSGANARQEATPATIGDSDDDWTGRLRLAAVVGLIAAFACTLLLLLSRLRHVWEVARLRIASVGTRASPGDGSSRRRMFETIERLGLVGSRFLGGARGDAAPLSKLGRQRNVRVGDVAFGVLSVTAAGMFALYVALLLSA